MKLVGIEMSSFAGTYRDMPVVIDLYDDGKWMWNVLKYSTMHDGENVKWLINADGTTDVFEEAVNAAKKVIDNYYGGPMTTVNGKDPKLLTSRNEALEYCYKHADKFIENDGQEQYDCLVEILRGGTIEPSEITDYGMSDQDLGLV